MATITILGGGVAGLALAATIDPTAYDVTLVERHPGYSPVPTALGIWPFALAALERIKLADGLRARGLLLNAGVITADSTRRPVAMTTQDARTWVITRPGLLQLLDEAVPDTVRRVERQVDDPTTLDADLVVAADGARSVVRGRVWGQTPRDTGIVAIRGVVATPPDMPGDRMHEYWGEGMLFGVAPNRLPHGVGTNWYASARRGADTPEQALSWARAAYAGFPPLVRATLAAAEPEQTVVNTILEARRPRTLVRDRPSSPTRTSAGSWRRTAESSSPGRCCGRWRSTASAPTATTSRVRWCAWWASRSSCTRRGPADRRRPRRASCGARRVAPGAAPKTRISCVQVVRRSRVRMNEGVEWAAHICVLLHWLHEADASPADDDAAGPAPVPVARLAEAYDLPAAYLVKQVQALTRAGITASVPGKYGGVRLARPADRITLMDVVAAIEGPDDAFACTEIRRRGMNQDRPARDFAAPCGIAQAMRGAELAWRRELAATSVRDLARRTPRRIADDARRHFART